MISRYLFFGWCALIIFYAWFALGFWNALIASLFMAWIVAGVDDDKKKD